MPRYPRSTTASTSGAAFRARFAELDRAIHTYGLWLHAQSGAQRARSTAANYPSIIRGVFTRILIDHVPPSRALAMTSAASVSAAMRKFYAFAENGGWVDGPPLEGALRYPPFIAVIPEGIRALLRTRLNTRHGDLLARCNLVNSVQAVWSTTLPDDLAPSPVRFILSKVPGDNTLYQMKDTMLEQRQGGDKDRPLRAFIRLALFSYAGGQPPPWLPMGEEAPLIPAWPFDSDGPRRHVPPMGASVLWDLAGRPSTDPSIPLPLEGEALLAGEAIDPTGASPLYPDDLTPADFRGMTGSQHSRVSPMDNEARIIEQLTMWANMRLGGISEYDLAWTHGTATGAGLRGLLDAGRVTLEGGLVYLASAPAPAPAPPAPGWGLAVDVRGVVALGEDEKEDLVSSGNLPGAEQILTDREDAEAPPPVVVDAFDAPELPPT